MSNDVMTSVFTNIVVKTNAEAQKLQVPYFWLTVIQASKHPGDSRFILVSFMRGLMITAIEVELITSQSSGTTTTTAELVSISLL